MKYNPERLTERVNKTITFNQLHDEFEPYYLNKVKRGDMPRSTFNVYLESMVRVLGTDQVMLLLITGACTHHVMKECYGIKKDNSICLY